MSLQNLKKFVVVMALEGLVAATWWYLKTPLWWGWLILGGLAIVIGVSLEVKQKAIRTLATAFSVGVAVQLASLLLIINAANAHDSLGGARLLAEPLFYIFFLTGFVIGGLMGLNRKSVSTIPEAPCGRS